MIELVENIFTGINLALTKLNCKKMTSKHIKQFQLSGEVTEILAQDSKCVVKIVCRPKYLVLSSDLMNDLHLGDKVVIEGSYHISKIDHEFE